jgi:hypothetical protein
MMSESQVQFKPHLNGRKKNEHSPGADPDRFPMVLVALRERSNRGLHYLFNHASLPTWISVEFFFFSYRHVLYERTGDDRRVIVFCILILVHSTVSITKLNELPSVRFEWHFVFLIGSILLKIIMPPSSCLSPLPKTWLRVYCDTCHMDITGIRHCSVTCDEQGCLPVYCSQAS